MMEYSVWGRRFCVAILRACSAKKDLYRGTRVHADVLKRGLLEKSSHVATALVSMYSKCGEHTKAKLLLVGLSSPTVFSWNALLAGYAQHGHGEEALTCFEQMQCKGLSPDEVTFTCILKACGSIGAVNRGERIHDEIVRQGLLGKDIVLGNALVDMYAKCGVLPKARRVFDELPDGNVVSWNALIGGYAQHEHGEEALNCFELMELKGLAPDPVTFTCVLKSCGSIGAIEKGEQIHDKVARQGLLGKDVVLGNALLDMYAKCGAFAKAKQVLDEFLFENVASWNALIAGYTQHGQGKEALNCFEQMEHKGLSPNEVTFTCILKACGIIGAADKGEHIHDQIVRQGLLKNNIILGNALVDMYAKCGALVKAQKLLNELSSRNVTSWNAIIAGYAQQGQGEIALNSYERMQSEGLSPNAVTLTYALKACGSIGEAKKGEEIHNDIVRQGLLEKDSVHVAFLGSALVDMYAKCSALAKAQLVLEDLSVKDVVLWNVVIGGYAQQGQGEDALNCFELMQHRGPPPDAVTFTCILKACGNTGAADKGECIHDEIAKQGLLEKDTVLGNALVDMYSKCGALAKAQQVLKELPVGDVVSWNALLGGYAQQGHGQDVLNCVKWMQWKGIAPDAITFSCTLTACSHAGLLDEGQTCFVDMITKYGIMPDVEHYTCMVDLFGRAGHFEKAVAMMQQMPACNHSSVWAALLGACCRKWGDVIVASWAFEHAIQLDKSDAAFYVCMANIYAAAGMQQDAELVEGMRLKNKAWSRPS